MLTSDARTIGAQTYTTGYTYESAGRLSSITYASSGWKVSYTRDGAGQISAVTAKPPSSGTVNVATSISYQPFGPMKNLTWANGVASSRIFDVDYRMTSLTDTGSSGNIQFLSYGYDAANNVTGIGDNVTAGNTQGLTYDALSRISYASGSYGVMSSITYDSNSNLTRYNNTGYTVAAGSNQQTKSGSTNITYTSTGGMSAVGTSFTMTWNKANQLATAAAFGTTNAYAYDAFGQRLTSKAGTANALVHQYGPDGMLIETAGGSGLAVSDYVWLDGTPIAAIKPSTAAIYALHTDRLGTPQQGTDSAQAGVWSAGYAPFGATTPTGTITVPLRFPGQFTTDTAPFYNNGLRPYYPAVPRYLQPDLIGLNGGWNTYAYALQNPYRYVDPWGLETLPVSLGLPLTSGAYPFGIGRPFIVRPQFSPSIPCPLTMEECAQSSDFQPYFGDPSWFHCGEKGFTQKNAPENHQIQECFYGPKGNLDTSACGGSPDDFDTRKQIILHAISDRGGISYPFLVPSDVTVRGYIESHPASR